MEEKPHKPTPKKLRDARKRGEVVKSKELNSLALFIGLLAFLGLGAGYITERLIRIVERAIASPASTPAVPEWPWLHDALAILYDLFWVLLPLLAIGLSCAVLVGGMQTRGVFSMTPIMPKFERINPGQGLQNLFSTRQLFELGKMLVKTGLLMGLLAATIAFSLDALVKMVYAPAAELLRISGTTILTLMAWTAVIYALGATADYAHQHHEFMKKQKMSTDEVRREFRDTEGDPQIKSKRRSTGRELAFSNSVRKTASASVVIANPSHVSVALYYVEGETDLPLVVAKGLDAIALRIRAEAERHNVPIMEDAPLARQLFQKTPLDQFIGEELIDPVAAVFRWARSVDCRQA